MISLKRFVVFALCPSAVGTNPMWTGGRIVYLGRESPHIITTLGLEPPQPTIPV